MKLTLDDKTTALLDSIIAKAKRSGRFDHMNTIEPILTLAKQAAGGELDITLRQQTDLAVFINGQVELPAWMISDDDRKRLLDLQVTLHGKGN